MYNINIREEVFGATVSVVKTGKREYISKEELEIIKSKNIFPQGTFASKINEEYKIKYIPLDTSRKIKNQFSFADIIYLELTRGCNLRCKHCLNNSGEIMDNQLNEEEFEKLIMDFSKAGVQEIRFTGGEPLLYGDIYKLLKLCTDNGVCTSLGTNGTLINKEIAENLRKAGLKKAVISIDGTKDMHDKIRGKGNFEKAMSGLTYLKEAGIDVRVNAVIMKSNMEDVIKLAKELNKKEITLFIRRFIESGRGEKLKDNMLSKKDYQYVKAQLSEELSDDRPYVNGHYLRINEGVHPRIPLPFTIRGCKAGQRAISIMPDGDIQLCGFLSAQGFKSIDNIRNIRNWTEFWDELQKLDKLKSLRDTLDEYNSIPNVQETYCLAYIQRYLNLKEIKEGRA